MDDHTCYIKTTFDKHKLLHIYKCFGLEDIAAQNNGYIRIPTGYMNQRGVPYVYNFHPEELFLYFMTRMKTGNDHTIMCNDIFGGREKRWSLAWRWILFYLDERYKNIIDWTSGTVAFCGRRLPPILQCNPATSAAILCA